MRRHAVRAFSWYTTRGIERALGLPSEVIGSIFVYGVSCTTEVIEVMRRQVSRTEIPRMPDRIIAATAVYLQVPIISRDGRIRSSQTANDLVSEILVATRRKFVSVDEYIAG